MPTSLDAYSAKRNFKQTPEPGPDKKTAKKDRLVYVIQRHDARRLHYDLRLELDGVLKSWAVPKGIPMEPGIRNLAVMVEDHPFEYRKFAGEIPKGQYGAGHVEIWDKGV